MPRHLEEDPAIARPLHGLHSAFDRAYLTCPAHVRLRPLREQSDEIMRLAAKACSQVPSHWMLDSTERSMVGALSEYARNPLALEAFIAELHRDFPDDDFPTARLDPLARRGWPPAPSCQERAIERHPPWSEDFRSRRRFARGHPLPLRRGAACPPQGQHP